MRAVRVMSRARAGKQISAIPIGGGTSKGGGGGLLWRGAAGGGR
jgi:hypothetical protein